MKNIRFELFNSFFKIGLFTFGGGYAMIPLITEETVNRKHWITDEDILDVIAIAESSPGPIAVNSATFIGYKLAGISGAACATLGVVLPSFLIIFCLSFVLKQFENIKAVQYAFTGIRAAVLALLLKALLKMYKSCPKGWMEYALMLISFVAVTVFDIQAIYVIICAAIIGIFFKTVLNQKEVAK